MRDGRGPTEPRPVEMRVGVLPFPDGSAEVRYGRTRVLASAFLVEGTPDWLPGGGWLTAEYNMLPGSVPERKGRERGGREREIGRMIGRALRAVCRLEALEGYTLLLDVDVLVADGGTRCAGLTAAYLAAHRAQGRALSDGRLGEPFLVEPVVGMSAGLVDGEVLCDLDREEDQRAQVDLNVAFTGGGSIADISGTGEGGPFGREVLLGLLDAAWKGASVVLERLKEVV